MVHTARSLDKTSKDSFTVSRVLLWLNEDF